MINTFFNTIFIRLTKSCFFLALLLGGIALVAAQSVPSGTFAGGKGTEQSPYLIKTKQQLAAVGKFTGELYKGLCFKQVADIIFTEKDFASGGEFYNNGQGWIPIGEQNQCFMGCFDGDFKTIEGIKSHDRKGEGKEESRKDNSSKGLFGFASACVIKNVVLKNYSFELLDSSFCMAGGLIARLYESPEGERKSLIMYNYVQGKIVVSNFLNNCFVGGIIGEMYQSKPSVLISHNRVDVDIFCNTEVSPPSNFRYNVGGVAGLNNHGVISCNKVTGKITATMKESAMHEDPDPNVGGIAGYSQGIISGNYTQLELRTFKAVGGIVGNNKGRVENNVSLCSSLDVTATGKQTFDVGRVVGRAGWMGFLENNYAFSNIKIAPQSQWHLKKGSATKDGEDFPNAMVMDSWKNVGFVFGNTEEAPWAGKQGKKPELYWYANMTGEFIESVPAEEGSPLFRVQQQFCLKKELIGKELQVLVVNVFLNQKDFYVQKLTSIFDNYLKQNKLEESLPIQDTLDALKVAQAVSDLPQVDLPVPAEKERREFEKQLAERSQAVVAEKKAEYMAFKEKYIAALVRLKAKLIGVKDIKNALVVEQEIKAMKADMGESFEELLFSDVMSSVRSNSGKVVSRELEKNPIADIRKRGATSAKKVAKELTKDDIVEISFEEGCVEGAFVQLTIKTMQESRDFTYIAELELLDEKGAPLPRDQWAVKTSTVETERDNGKVENLLDGNVDTFWHSQYTPVNTLPPYIIEIDLGRKERFSKIRLKNRKIIDAFTWQGRPKHVEVEVSHTPF